MRHRIGIHTYFLFFLFFLVACVPGQQLQSVNSHDDSVTVTDPGEFDSYVVGKGDILEIITWKEPDFSKEVKVRMDGKFSFPLIGGIQAAGRTPDQIKDDIQNKLQRYVTQPHLSVSIKDPVSQKFYIVGEVKQPGEYPLIKNLTVMQAFALAGGFTEWAAKKEIVLIRKEDEKQKKININYNEIEKGLSLHQNIDLRSDDIIVVP